MSDAATPVDEAKVEEFVGKVLTDVSGMTTTVLAAIGDRLGLWKALASQGPATSTELAERAGVNDRYAKGWERSGCTRPSSRSSLPRRGTATCGRRRWTIPSTTSTR